MSIERERLLSLIEFAEQSARLRSKPRVTVAEHGLFALYEHQIQGLPGIHVSVTGTENEDEIWLVVERLRETRPPAITSPRLRPWVHMAESPNEEPRILESVDGASLIKAGSHCSSLSPPEQGKPRIDPEATVILSDYDGSALVRAEFSIYVDTKWRLWAKEEKLRRETIRIYSRLFTLKQQLEGGIVEAQIELVWGVGLGLWNAGGTVVTYPLVGRLVELSLNPETADVEIRPRDVDPRLEIDWYASVDNPGVAGLERAAKEFFGKATTTFSPFDRSTFEPLLRTAVTHLDANGIYWPNEVPTEDRTLPRIDDKLKVTDTWVLFGRPRSNSLFVEDLQKLRKNVEDAESYPPAVAAVVTEPDRTNPVVDLTPFRGVSASYHTGQGTSDKSVRELYFPKPFNDEQVRIVQLLDVADGVVVQGPPGTGKTHTIANVICHYLAEGKRVLVTSMKDPALAVLQEQLPAEIRPLAISLLTSEQEGMKQFEHAIQKIASEVQRLDRVKTAREIRHLQELIDTLHGKLASIDQKTGEWAKRNLTKIRLETETIEPQDAAREVTKHSGQFEWIPDALGVENEFVPQFTDLDVVQVREARRNLKQDIDYLDASLPQVIEFPDSGVLLQVHQDLSAFEKLKKGVDSGVVPALADSSQETLTIAQQLLQDVEILRSLRHEVVEASRPWTATMRERLHREGADPLVQMLEALGAELDRAIEQRRTFLERPVITPTGIEVDSEFVDAVDNLAEGKRPFGLSGLFLRTVRKKQLDSVRVLGNPPTDVEDWEHVVGFLRHLRSLRELAVRWNTLARELPIEAMPGDGPNDGLAAGRSFALYRKVKNAVAVEDRVYSTTRRVFPSWPHALEVRDDTERLSELEKALRHHLTKHRLANVWAAKERIQNVLTGRSGRIVDDIRDFLATVFGNATVGDAEMQTKWAALTAELSRVLGLGVHLAVVRDVCGRVKASGAPKYAAMLTRPINGTVDDLLPDNWRQSWRLKRLASYLDSIDVQEELKSLAKERDQVASDLARAYSDIVVKRTWLKLAENASPSVRAALQAYLNAIQKIGKGTGRKRTVRYRHDARMAASHATPAVPCWIMAHYRVSESLPAEVGFFDLVVIDEASQSDLTGLPSLLRARKVLIVGDDKQVSPEGVGLEEEKVRSLMARFLSTQVETYRPQMSPERSIYDLFRVVFAKSAVMLKEHFRCVGPIIEYSKREFYNHELQPLRVPKGSERLDPPLIDVLVEDGYRSGDVNLPEARFIVDEIRAIVSDAKMARRSIGVVSLLANKQAAVIWERLTDELGPEVMERHRIGCGDARAFQGKERDIMFLSMVSAPNDVGAPLSRDTFAQRFNVAASRARDRMYLVRSVRLENLSAADALRRSLITHLATPFVQDESLVEDRRQLCESPFEREMYDELTKRGYLVTPQVSAGQYRIDLVVEGHNDARLAVECDGDKYHGMEKWSDDVQRQRVLERAGWVFWRCFASAFVRRRDAVLSDLLQTLAERGIEPIGAEGAARSVHTEHRIVTSVRARAPGPHLSGSVQMFDGIDVRSDAVPSEGDGSVSENVAGVEPRMNLASENSERLDHGPLEGLSVLERRRLPFSDYAPYEGRAGDDPRDVNARLVAEGIVRIIEVEGPVIAKRVYDVYLRGCGIKRMGHELKSAMNRALSDAIRQGRVVHLDEVGKGGLLFSIVRLKGTPPIALRRRGPRSFEEIPPSELLFVAKVLLRWRSFERGSDEHLRAVLECFDLRRLTTQVGSTLLEILDRDLPHVDELLAGTEE